MDNGNVLKMLTELDGKFRSEEHTSELQSQSNLVCRLLLEKKKTTTSLITLTTARTSTRTTPSSRTAHLTIGAHCTSRSTMVIFRKSYALRSIRSRTHSVD